ncbi:MAG: DEAD/DEAH box helicase [Lachnospiraceae bacterium]|nr:DEAD/DEAH box helicase [Lachnospiraceae bacterium]
MLEIKDILSSCGYRQYEEGRDLYGSKKISDLEISKDTMTGANIVKGIVEENARKYNSVIWVDERRDEKPIYGYQCSCEGFSEKMCKHCVAVAFSYLKYRKTEIMKKQVVPVSKDRETSKDLQEVIRKYAITKESITDKGRVNLDLNLTTTGDENGITNYYVNAKIGTGKMIIVQDIVGLAQNMAAKKKIQYSKKLSVIHDRMVFTEEALPRLDFIMELVKATFSNFENEITISNKYRSLAVNPFFLERIFNVYIGKEISIDNEKYRIIEGNPNLCLMIKNENDCGISVAMKPVKIINGDRHDFLMVENEIYKCSEEFSKDVIPFIRAMNSMEEKKSKYLYYDRNFDFINKEDYRAFCGNVLLRLKKHIGIVCEDIDIEEYMPTKAKINVYIDNEEGKVSLKLHAIYGKDVYDVFEVHNESREYRDITRESNALEVVQQYFDVVEDEEGNRKWQITNEDKLFDFLDDGVAKLNDIADVFMADTLNSFRVIQIPKPSVGISLVGDLIDINIEPDELNMEEMYEVLQAYRLRKKYYRMKNGDFLRIDDGNVAFLSEITTGLMIQKQDILNGDFKVKNYYVGYINATFKEFSTDDTIRRDSDFKKIIRDLKDVGETDYSVPAELNAKLRKYQKTGYRFLSVLSDFNFGGILADDMGLGKTLQVITLLEARKKQALIVCPSSLVYNWESEINRFAPDLSVLTIIGDRERRKNLLDDSEEYHILLTSYDLLKRDIDEFENKEFDYIIIDEAQYIKNPATQVSIAVKRLKGQHKFALTGTPIENRLSDLYSIFDFIMPGYLSDYKTFRDKYEEPIVLNNDEEVLNRFKKVVSPFILRREKSEVLKDLPAKIENVVYVNMTEEQQKLYDARVNALKTELANKNDKEFREDKLKILAELTRLRQICCNPDICYENYHGGSGKMDTCIELIKNAIEGGHRILVFSQFVQMLSRIYDELEKCGINVLMLSGKNTKEERRKMVEEFQEEKVPVFLISLKAGGTGLNLTAADIVIHFDPWWNGAVQNQATDRAHRIGQIRTLTVMKLVAKGTIEQKIMDLQERKLKLADNVVSGENMSNINVNLDDLKEIL